MRRLQTKGPGLQTREMVKGAGRPDSRRIEDLKRRCQDDFQRLKVSVELLAFEIGPLETMDFAHTMWTLDKIGVKSPW